jgi:CheY-like chemotaxis protein
MSNGQLGIKWRFLIVEDKEDKIRQLQEIAPACVDAPDEVEVDVCPTFKKAAGRLRTERFDLLILDLKDDSDTSIAADTNPAGLAVFEELKRTRFVPVVFYTALAHKVRSEETSFVRVVEKTEDVTRVKEEVRRVFATKLPTLTRHVEELQRDYMWEFVSKHWKDFHYSNEQADLAYLLARRLALSLEKEARKLSRKMTGKTVPMADPKNIHPMEMYIPPPLGSSRQAGDILKGTVAGVSGYWITLTPSCDFEQPGRLNNVLIAQCAPLASEPEYLAWKEKPAANIGGLNALIGDNRQDAQSERFKFLPGTFFFPDSVVDFQRLQAIPPNELAKMEVIASLDSPFAEALLARFSRYFGRLGTPDIDKNVLINRLQSALGRSVAIAAAASPVVAPRAESK